MATDLGFSGSPSVHVWVKIEKEITKRLSNIAHESTSQSRQRLGHFELSLHEFRTRIELLLHESTNESRQRFEHIESLLLNPQQHVGLQSIRHNMSADMGKTYSYNAEAPIVPWCQELRFKESAVEPPPAARGTRIQSLDQGVRPERAAQVCSQYTNMVQVTQQITAKYMLV